MKKDETSEVLKKYFPKLRYINLNIYWFLFTIMFISFLFAVLNLVILSLPSEDLISISVKEKFFKNFSSVDSIKYCGELGFYDLIFPHYLFESKNDSFDESLIAISREEKSWRLGYVLGRKNYAVFFNDYKNIAYRLPFNIADNKWQIGFLSFFGVEIDPQIKVISLRRDEDRLFLKFSVSWSAFYKIFILGALTASLLLFSLIISAAASFSRKIFYHCDSNIILGLRGGFLLIKIVDFYAIF